MRTYRKSRTGYPDGVLGIYDNDGETIDRYTVVYTPFAYDGRSFFPYVGMSGAPFHPQGFCQHGESTFRITSSAWGNVSGAGRTIDFGDLPEDCQRAVRHDLEDSEVEA